MLRRSPRPLLTFFDTCGPASAARVGHTQEDARVGRDVTKQRRFIVSEGLFKNDGSMAPLAELVRLKARYGYRLILDESLSFGALGATGRGLAEHAGVEVAEVDVVLVTMEYGLASVGGLCCGSIEVVDHQRLSGAGYCFSASAPPFVSSAATTALRMLDAEPQLVAALRGNVATLRSFIKVRARARGGALLATARKRHARIPISQAACCFFFSFSFFGGGCSGIAF